MAEKFGVLLIEFTRKGAKIVDWKKLEIKNVNGFRPITETCRLGR